MKKYFSFFKMELKKGLQYRTAAIAGIMTQFFWGFMLLLLYKAFYNSDPTSIPMDYSQLTSYVWLQQGFMSLLFIWFWVGDIFASIENGNVAYELCRPINLYSMWFVKILSFRLSKTILKSIPFLIVVFLLPKPYTLNLPMNFESLLLFILSITLGLLVLITLSLIVYASAFYTISSYGTRIFVAVFADFMAGGILPLPFWPDKIRFIAELLPFSSIMNVPLRIYIGDIAGNEIIYHMGIQLIWLGILLVLGIKFFKKSTKRIIIQGG